MENVEKFIRDLEDSLSRMFAKLPNDNDWYVADYPAKSFISVENKQGRKPKYRVKVVRDKIFVALIAPVQHILANIPLNGDKIDDKLTQAIFQAIVKDQQKFATSSVKSSLKKLYAKNPVLAKQAAKALGYKMVVKSGTN